MKDERRRGERREARWPFDPMQPGDHEPVRTGTDVERVQKQTGNAERRRQEDRRKT